MKSFHLLLLMPGSWTGELNSPRGEGGKVGDGGRRGGGGGYVQANANL